MLTGPIVTLPLRVAPQLVLSRAFRRYVVTQSFLRCALPYTSAGEELCQGSGSSAADHSIPGHST